MPRAMYHMDCGGLLAWRLGASAARGALMRSDECILSDGSTPIPLSRPEFPCQKCGAKVKDRADMTSFRGTPEAA